MRFKLMRGHIPCIRELNDLLLFLGSPIRKSLSQAYLKLTLDSKLWSAEHELQGWGYVLAGFVNLTQSRIYLIEEWPPSD